MIVFEHIIGGIKFYYMDNSTIFVYKHNIFIESWGEHIKLDYNGFVSSCERYFISQL